MLYLLFVTIIRLAFVITLICVICTGFAAQLKKKQYMRLVLPCVKSFKIIVLSLSLVCKIVKCKSDNNTFTSSLFSKQIVSHHDLFTRNSPYSQLTCCTTKRQTVVRKATCPILRNVMGAPKWLVNIPPIN